ncbi:endonuclease/exonuclease/phosphatase family protein [Bacillus cereus]|uniref:endonuclease/exonuclease/phosphatase family protein n=1 Tax=Bacillus cereus TaxID=1396 RepID=UPI001879B5D3|nr:endonuclease/exonuclease/phosphatase family protein [Bacillus cereus]MBE7123132.1 endonuclease/exonuclease/phosphatase family protein [Bacillus cereus]
MKLVTWNAAMRFRDKIEKILPFTADILVIPECEAPEKWRASKYQKAIEQFLWFGDNPNKGIGIITLNDTYQIELHPSYKKDFRYIIPLIVTGEQDFILFAVWSQNTKNRYDSYIGQIYKALEYYEPLLQEPCIIVGDWNSNKIFDHIKRVGTHSEVVELLKGVGIMSAYHYHFNEEHGQESRPTHYFRKEKARPFHIDFLFASEIFLKQLSFFEIGSFEKWIKFSDHIPISTEFDK